MCILRDEKRGLVVFFSSCLLALLDSSLVGSLVGWHVDTYIHTYIQTSLMQLLICTYL